MDEIWMPIEGYEEYYEISSHGRVKSVERVCYNPSVLGGGCYRRVPGGIRKPNVMKGYHCIALIKDKHTKVFRIHRLVAEHFIGKQPTPEHQVNHINGVKSDNRVENLEWVTPAENTRHAIETGLRGNLDEATRRKLSENSKQNWSRPDYRENQSLKAKAAWANEERHRARSLAIKEGIARAKERRAVNV